MSVEDNKGRSRRKHERVLVMLSSVEVEDMRSDASGDCNAVDLCGIHCEGVVR